jgi:hypothetical protein
MPRAAGDPRFVMASGTGDDHELSVNRRQSAQRHRQTAAHSVE